MNDGYGLGELTEGGNEAKMKFVRRYKEIWTRKTDQDSCMTDTMNRLYLDACPVIRKYKPEPIRKSRVQREETSDDLLVKSFLILDDEN